MSEQKIINLLKMLFVKQDGYRCLCTKCYGEVTAKQRELRKLSSTR